MKIRDFFVYLLSIIHGFRCFPLYLLWKMRLFLKDDGAVKFLEDLHMAKHCFFLTMFLKPQYKMLLYARLGYISYPLKCICGTFPITIDSKYNMPLGKGFEMEHPHGSHIHAKSIGDYLSIKHNVTIGVNHNELPIIGNHVSISVGACILGGGNYWR